MERRKRKKHSYTISLAASFLIVAAAWGAGILQKGDRGIALYFPKSIDEVYAVSDHTGEAEEPDLRAEEAGGPQEETEAAGPSGPEAGDTTAPEGAQGAQEHVPEAGEAPEPAMYEADTSYFDDALFIGDSRTVGLSEYGDLGNAEVLADSGMNVYKIFDKEFDTASGEKKLLETILSERQFGKIYVMLGINELGYDPDQTVARYEALVEKLEEAQPEAKLFLQANLHITAKKSETSPVYTNENIDRFNQAVEQMTDGRNRFYLDVNELFDDENGNLSETYTMDNAHVLGKYYADWVAWILQHAR